MVLSPRFSSICPSFSSLAISAGVNWFTFPAILPISLPYFGPKTLKLGLADLTMTPEASSSSCISLTLISDNTKSLMACKSSRSCADKTGIIIFCKGWRTLIFSFLRKDNAKDEINWAFCILRSKSLSISAGLTFGNSAKCTDSKFSLPVTPIKSK